MKNTKSAKSALQRTLASVLSAVATGVTYAITFSASAEGDVPTGIKTDTMTKILTLIFWVVRIIILIIAVPGFIKIVQGQADENPRDRNAGIATVAIAGVAFAATFAILPLITSSSSST